MAFSYRAFMLLLPAACASSPAGQPPIEQTRVLEPEPVGALRWRPPIIDVLGDDPATAERDLVTVESTTLEWCSRESGCRPVVKLDPPRVIRGHASSGDGRYAVIEHGAPRGASGLGFYDAVKGVELAWVMLDGGISAGAPPELQWTAGNNLIRSWSAGSDDMIATLYDAHGHVVGSFGAPVLSIAPDGRYLIAYTQPWTPVAMSQSFEIYDLSNGKELASLRADLSGVTGVEWRDDGVVVTYQSLSGQTRELVYRLD